jgi:aminopeptidase N
VVLSGCLGRAAWGQVESPGDAAVPRAVPPRYTIDLDVDYRAATFTGRAVVALGNATRRDLDSLDFFLYPNVGQGEEEPPHLTVERAGVGGVEVRAEVKARGTLLHVALPSKLGPGEAVEVTLDFTGRVPRLQREETTLLAHFLHEANDAVSSERQRRDARDIFFAADQAMLLGYFFPLLAPPDAVVSEQGLAFGVGGVVFSEAGDYEVTVRADGGLTVLGSAPAAESQPLQDDPARRAQTFRGQNLRGFALVLCEQVQPVTAQAGAARVTAYFKVGNENVSRRMLAATVRALEVYSGTFGAYAFPALSVVELPLPAGYSGIEFPGIVVLAQAYCIDFASPQSSRLPGIIREQADVIESALEFTLAHCLAHQWWGGAVGSDPQRNPYMDEALANFAAVYYFEAAYGAAAGAAAVNKHLRATYQVYRSLGGADAELDKSARDFRSAMQYAAIVQAKGAMMMVALRKQLGDAAFFKAIKDYYAAFRFRFAAPRDLREAFLAVSPDPQVTKNLLHRYLKEKRGDRDIGTPDVMLLAAQSSKARRLGRFFGRIGRAAARPF